MKYLYIARHGEAEGYATSDFARKLTREGREEVQYVANWLLSQSDILMPERIVSSPASRALSTAEVYAKTFGLISEHLAIARELYSGDANIYLNTLVKSLSDEVSCAMVVGHNPAVTELLSELLGRFSTVEEGYLMRKGDVACVVFDLPASAGWQEIYVAPAKLEQYVIASSVCHTFQG